MMMGKEFNSLSYAESCTGLMSDRLNGTVRRMHSGEMNGRLRGQVRKIERATKRN